MKKLIISLSTLVSAKAENIIASTNLMQAHAKQSAKDEYKALIEAEEFAQDQMKRAAREVSYHQQAIADARIRASTAHSILVENSIDYAKAVEATANFGK